MRKITWQSADAFLLDDPHNPQVEPELTAELPVFVEQGLTDRETRAQLGDTLRLSFTFRITLRSAEEVTQFRNALQEYSTQPLLCPLWVAMRHPGDFHPVSADWYLLTHDDASAEVLDATSAGTLSPSDEWLVPLMVGHLAEWPEPSNLTNTWADIDISFQESSALPISLASFSVPAGLTVNGITPTLFPFRHHANQAPSGQAATVTVDRSLIGDGREFSNTFFPQPSRRRERRSYILQDGEAWQLLRYFQDIGAAKSPLWLPGATQEVHLTADVTGSEGAIPVDNPGARGLNTTFILDDGENRTPIQVSGTSGSAWTLTGTFGTPYKASETAIFSLLLARWDAGKLVLRFTTPTFAVATCQFVEVPWETVSPGDETYGTTTGTIGTKAFLYVFRTTLLGHDQVWRFTSFERALTYSGNTYAKGPFDHGEISESIGFDLGTVDLTSFVFPGNPLNKLSPFSLEAPLFLEIYECSVSGNTASGLVCVFYGEVVGRGAKFTGPKIQTSPRSFGRLLDLKFPRMLVQVADNHTLFDPGNGLDRSAWEWTALVTSYDPSTFTLAIGTIKKGGVSATGLAQHYFANGTVLIGTGDTAQLRRIADNAAESGTSMSLTLASDITPPSVGDAISIWPGYDLQYSTAKAKFSNKAKFGGFPYVPLSNPTLTKVAQAASTGGKK